MKMIEQISEMWAKDGAVDPTNLTSNIAEISSLHNKYYKMFANLVVLVKEKNAELKRLKLLKTEYYNGTMPHEDLVENGWEPNPLKILRTDIDKYIEADKDVIKLTLRVASLQAAADFLESIIRQINNRGYNLKTLADYQRFREGLN